MLWGLENLESVMDDGDVVCLFSANFGQGCDEGAEVLIATAKCAQVVSYSKSKELRDIFAGWKYVPKVVRPTEKMVKNDAKWTLEVSAAAEFMCAKAKHLLRVNECVRKAVHTMLLETKLAYNKTVSQMDSVCAASRRLLPYGQLWLDKTRKLALRSRGYGCSCPNKGIAVDAHMCAEIRRKTAKVAEYVR